MNCPKVLMQSATCISVDGLLVGISGLLVIRYCLIHYIFLATQSAKVKNLSMFP